MNKNLDLEYKHEWLQKMADVCEASSTIDSTLFSKYEYDDIYNELVLALLNMANKYKITQPGEKFHKENGTFHMYVSKCFHWEAYKFLKKLVHDPLAHYEVVQLCDQFDKLEFENHDFISGYCPSQGFNKILQNA